MKLYPIIEVILCNLLFYVIYPNKYQITFKDPGYIILDKKMVEFLELEGRGGFSILIVRGNLAKIII